MGFEICFSTNQMAIVGMSCKQTIISFAHSALQGLNCGLPDVAILALDLDNNTRRKFISIGCYINTTIPSIGQ